MNVLIFGDRMRTEVKPLAEITEKEFKAFIKVRDSGQTNMWDASAVARLSKGLLDRSTHVGIISNWEALAKKFPNAETRK